MKFFLIVAWGCVVAGTTLGAHGNGGSSGGTGGLNAGPTLARPVHTSLTQRRGGAIPTSTSAFARQHEHEQQRQGQQSSSLHAVIASADPAVASKITAAALRAVAKLIATCGMGVAAGKSGLLDKVALSVLSKLVFGLLQPCLLFVSVASTMAKMDETGTGPVRVLPLMALIQVTLGFVVGKVVSLLVYGRQQSSEEAKQLLACTTFGNAGPLPLVFVDALLKTHADSTYLPKSVAYVSLYLLAWSPLFWIFMPAILSPARDATKPADPKEQLRQLAARVFSPPVMGSLAGMLVGLVPFLRKLFVSNTGALHPIFGAAQTLGTGYLPAVLLVLAGSMTPTSPTADEVAAAAAAKKRKSSGSVATAAAAAAGAGDQLAFTKQIVAIYAARFVVMPTVGFALIAAAKKHVPSLATLLADPVLVFVLLLETCMPSAQNGTVVLQLLGNRGAAARMARVLMFIYVLGVPAISYWLVQILSMTGLAA